MTKALGPAQDKTGYTRGHTDRQLDWQTKTTRPLVQVQTTTPNIKSGWSRVLGRILVVPVTARIRFGFGSVGSTVQNPARLLSILPSLGLLVSAWSVHVHVFHTRARTYTQLRLRARRLHDFWIYVRTCICILDRITTKRWLHNRTSYVTFPMPLLATDPGAASDRWAWLAGHLSQDSSTIHVVRRVDSMS